MRWLLVVLLALGAWGEPVRIVREKGGVRIFSSVPVQWRARTVGNVAMLDLFDARLVAALPPGVRGCRPDPEMLRLQVPSTGDSVCVVAEGGLLWKQVPRKGVRPGRVPSAEFEDADLVFAIKVLAREMGRNVYIGPGVEGKVTMSLRSVPPEGALAMLLGDEFDYKLLSKALIVATPEKLATIPDDILTRQVVSEGCLRQEILLQKAPADRVREILARRYPKVQFTAHPTMNGFYIAGPRADILAIKRDAPELDVYYGPPPRVVREVVDVVYADLTELKALLATLVPDVTYEANAEERTLAFEGLPTAVDQVKELLDEFDRPVDEVVVDAKLLALTPGMRRALGVLGPVTQELTLDEVHRPRPIITSNIQFLVSQSEARFLAAPRIALKSGQPGRISLEDGDQGMSLTCLAHAGLDGYITLTLSMQVTELVDNRSQARSLEKFIRVKDGDTLVLRGFVLPRGGTPGTWLGQAGTAMARGEQVVWLITPHLMK